MNMDGLENSFLILKTNFKDFFNLLKVSQESFYPTNHKELLSHLEFIKRNVVLSNCFQLITLSSFRCFVRLSHKFLITWCRQQLPQNVDICIELVRCLYNITNVGKLHGWLNEGVEEESGLMNEEDRKKNVEVQKKTQWKKLLKNKKLFECIIELVMVSNNKQIKSLSAAWLYINMINNDEKHSTIKKEINDGKLATAIDDVVCGGLGKIENTNKNILKLLNIEYEEEEEEEEEEEDFDDNYIEYKDEFFDHGGGGGIKTMALLVRELTEILMEDRVDSEWSSYILKHLLSTNDMMSVVCCHLPSKHVMMLLELMRDMMQEEKLTDAHIRWVTHTIQLSNHDKEVKKELWMCICDFTCNKHKCFRHFLIHTLDNLKKLQEKENKTKDNEDASVLKRCMLQVVANLLHVVEEACDLVREKDHISTILQCTNIDPLSPVSQQWALFAIHNLCVNNIDNQNYIASLKLERQNDLTNQLLDVGLRVELVDGKMKFYNDGER